MKRKLVLALLASQQVSAFLSIQSQLREVQYGIPTPFEIGRLHLIDSEASSSSLSSLDKNDNENSNPHHLPPELKKIADAFEMIGDDKLRYKQLLFMANQAKPMDESKKVAENLVPGCLSTVHVDGSIEFVENDYRIQFVGDSDGLLTKGLVALLVRGLSGSTASEIQKVDPAFIVQCGISTSLTPGRNNGFLNMLAVMKKKAMELEANADKDLSSTSVASGKETDGVEAYPDAQPMYKAIMTALQRLQPDTLELRDVSHQHAGHMEGGKGEESHFELTIVADAFEDLNLVKRHKLVYMMLGEVMPKIHALQITAKTPAEVQKA